MSAQGEIRDGDDAGIALIETLRWEPQAGFTRLGRHLSRLEGSARQLGFVFSKPRIETALDDAARGAAPLRARLVLAGDGRVEVSTSPFTPLPSHAVWTLRVAGVRLNSADPLLRHKTTRRQTYEAARAEFSRDEADEVILLNERGEVCEGTITNVFVDAGDGKLLTPALACGLLPGVLRGELIDVGKAVETVLVEDDLGSAKAIYVGNSLRGLIKGWPVPTRD